MRGAAGRGGGAGGQWAGAGRSRKCGDGACGLPWQLSCGIRARLPGAIEDDVVVLPVRVELVLEPVVEVLLLPWGALRGFAREDERVAPQSLEAPAGRGGGGAPRGRARYSME